MAIQEINIFKGADLSEEEAREMDETPHFSLLAEAFEALTSELEANGNTDQFINLRQDYARKLILYWKRKIACYRLAESTGAIKEGQAFVQGEESLIVSQLGVYESDDEVVLMINRKNRTEEDQVRIAANMRGEIDEFFRAPTIESQVKSDPDEAHNLSYKVIFGRNRFVKDSLFTIALFERQKVHEDPEHQHPWVYDTRTIRGSISDLSASI